MTERFWQIAILAAALGVTSKAEAAIYYWQESGAAAYQSEPFAPQRRQKAHRATNKKATGAESEAGRPQGPLVISISIAQQRLRVYDANGLFAETPVSTGMTGHSTPMGVFSVIQKQKFHRSNIYSGAPMPYMQRITWSGIAIHAGVLPGYPASHGCIRMPTAFAVKMYGWTRMGARVVVTPGAISPTGFSHPLLAALKVPPPPAVEESGPQASVVPQPAREVPAAMTSDATAPQADAASKIELRSNTSYEGIAKPAASGESSAPRAETPETAVASKQENVAKVEISNTETASSSAKAVDSPSAAAKPREVAIIGARAETATTGVAPSHTVEAPKKTEERAGTKPTDASMATVTPTATPAVATNAVASNPAPSNDVAKAPALKADAEPLSSRAGPIAVFVSRKDSKLYVRQNFSPLFSVPVSIAPSERPLGTHIFTARVDKNDPNVLHWSVVSLPAPSRRGEEPRRRKLAGTVPIEMKAVPMPDDPTEALDRLTLPADVMARIFEAISTGGSIIVSDQGIAAGETGEGTDFIVSLR